MHLGLINGPFVPHDLISTQGSPVPLPSFQMVPRLKLRWPSGPEKEPRYTFLFPSKVPANPSRFPTKAPVKREVPLMEPLAERCPTTRAFLHSTIRALDIRASPHIGFPRRQRGPRREGCPHPENFLTYLPGSPVKKLPPGPPRNLFRVPRKGALPSGSLHRAPTERDAPPLEPLSTILLSLQ
jgi:hypothetical protein